MTASTEAPANPPAGDTKAADSKAAKAADTAASTEDGVKGAGSADSTNAATSPVPNQVTQAAPVVEAEGARLAREAADKPKDPTVKPDYTTIAEATTHAGLAYDETGHLVDDSGRPVALSADATDVDIAWTAQHANRTIHGDNAVAYPGGPATVPDQTFHPSELPDPHAAIRAGLLPQNLQVLNIDPLKFDGKKSLEA